MPGRPAKEQYVITISHSYAEGTLIDGTSRGDGTNEILKANGWRWFRSLAQWGIPVSRDKPAKGGQIERTATALRAAGFEVTVEVDNTPRAMEASEADRAERIEARAERLHERAERKLSESDARLAAADKIGERFAMGQPILVGHHSERGARADQRRIEGHMDKFVELRAEARHAEAAAQAADVHMAHRENPRVVANRITRLEAERRKVQRNLDGYTRNSLNGRGEIIYQEVHKPAGGAWRDQLNDQAAYLDEQLRYWREQLTGSGGAVDISQIKAGDRIQVGKQWWPVLRVNKTTITVQRIGTYTKRVAHTAITGHKGAAEVAQPVDLDDAS
jgi:hypothetical protein